MTDTTKTEEAQNWCGLRGIAFLEWSSTPDQQDFGTLFEEFGFSKLRKHKSMEMDLFKQNDIVFLWNRGEDNFAAKFREVHGPSICAMGFFVDDAKKGFAAAVERGARAFEANSGNTAAFDVPAIYGIGESLIYFVDESMDFFDRGFETLESPKHVDSKGFQFIDHLTNNVYQGDMEKWSHFYKHIFGFQQVRYFDIRGEETGLLSYALRSPDGSFSIPINEGTEAKSQINEYLREYNGEGIQHIALSSEDLLASLDSLEGGKTEFLDIDDLYYQTVFERVPNVTEDHERIKHHNVLVDGDEDGYLLQIFTKNVVGPIFFELIQRAGHDAFGEGNFGALFRSIERDQRRRGVL